MSRVRGGDRPCPRFDRILFTERYPRSRFDFNVGVLRWTWRVLFYGYGMPGTDRYPPFTLPEMADYPAHFDVEYPERLSRGLVLVKWWLLVLPHYLVAAILIAGLARRGGGLLDVLVLFVAVALLCSGRYPKGLFAFLTGLYRWLIRVGAYASLMTDVCPPFRLDQGGEETTETRWCRVGVESAVESVKCARWRRPRGTTTRHRHLIARSGASLQPM